MENKNFSENENEKLFWEQKFSPFSEKFFLENSAQNGLKMGEQKIWEKTQKSRF